MTWLAVLCLLFHQQSVQMMEDFWTNYWALLVVEECRAACLSYSCITPFFRIISKDLICSQNPPPWQNGIDGLGQGAKIYSL